jgi:hypothetical protein
MDIKKFENICKMSQMALKNYVAAQLGNTHNIVLTGDGFVYAKGNFPVLLVAHMDTVHKQLPHTIVYNAATKSISSPNGIGGDDRCGIYMVLEVVKKFNCSVLFTEDEEIGGIGAEKFIETKLASELKFNYMIEFDRQGKNDAVFYDCDNPEFEEFITKEFYKTAWGSFSDISTLAPYIGCAAVNLSCGYYKAHTTEEYVIIPEMEKSIEEACKILERTTETDKFEYIEAEYTSYYSKYSKYYDYEEYFEEKYYTIEYADEKGKTQWYDTMALSEAEAVGKFCIDYPNMTYENIIEVCELDNYGY